MIDLDVCCIRALGHSGQGQGVPKSFLMEGGMLSGHHDVVTRVGSSLNEGMCYMDPNSM